MFDIKENLKQLPDLPGVYIHKDKYGEVIYVGKAISLRKRVRQYFGAGVKSDPKVSAMVSHIAEFEYIVTSSEMEALLLENILIKKHMPQYNVLLRDDKTYPYIKITMGEYWPRVLKTRVLSSDGSRYFGPYADVGAVNRIVELLNDVFRLKRCSTRVFAPDAKYCLNGHIGKCRGMCIGLVSHEEYMADIEDVIKFLKGSSKNLIDRLKSEMQAAADVEDFEQAARLRDQIFDAQSITERQRVELLSAGDMDIIIASEADESAMAQVTVFFVRKGRLSGREIHHLDAPKDEAAESIVAAFMTQYYSNQSVIPKDILLEAHIPDERLLEELLSDEAAHQVRLHVPQRGDKAALVRLARSDAEQSIRTMTERVEREREKETRLSEELKGIFFRDSRLRGNDTGGGNDIGGRDDTALRIEAYDISHTSGVDSVGALIAFNGSKPDKSGYRRFRIKSDVHGDDYAAMQEMIYRRMKRYQDGAKGFEKLPDLLFIDGGQGHVNSVKQVLDAMKINIAIGGMVKDDRHRTRGLIVGEEEIDLATRPELFHLVGSIQEEVHRFVIEYHRGKRGKSVVKSELDDIPGIGPKRRNALLLAFGSIDAISKADKSELEAVPGMNSAAADTILSHFSKK
jgi:excinuclease ABC subunit C